MGVLRNEENQIIDAFELGGTKYLPSLSGKTWTNTDPDYELPPELKLIIKRSKVHVSIILKESDQDAKYDLFQRLNTGGSKLSPQEVRNCIMVMLNRDLFTWLQELSTDENFQGTISLSDANVAEAYDVELALRFLIFSIIPEARLNNIGDVGAFITDEMTTITKADTFDKNKAEKLFRDTFATINNSLEDGAFKRYSAEKDRFMGGFLLSTYECIAYGISYNLMKNTLTQSNLREKIINMHGQEIYKKNSGSGVKANSRLPKLIPFGREFFSNHAD